MAWWEGLIIALLTIVLWMSAYYQGYKYGKEEIKEKNNDNTRNS